MTHEQSDDLWDACPPGVLRHQATAVRRARAVRRALIVGGVAGLLMMVVWAGMPEEPEIRFQFGDKNYGGILCSQLRKELPGYRAGNLDQSMKVKIDEHLRMCPTCRNLVRHDRQPLDLRLASQ